MLAKWPAGRRVAFTTIFCLAVALSIVALLQGLAPGGCLRIAALSGIILTATGVIGGGIGLAVAQLADYRDPESEEEFERLLVRSGALAPRNLAAEPGGGGVPALRP